MHQYFCYGLNIESAKPIHGLMQQVRSNAIDLQVHWHPHEQADLDWQLAEGIAFRQRARIQAAYAYTGEGKLRYRFDYNLASFGKVSSIIDESAQQLWLSFPASMSAVDCSSLFIGTIIGSVLRLKGLLCLHASVLRVNNKALLLIGESHAGKSTTAAALNQREQVSLIADDIGVIQADLDHGGFEVLPGYPAFRLHTNAVDALFDVGHSSLPTVYSNGDKCYFPLANTHDDTGWATEPVKIAAMCILKGKTDATDALNIEAVPTHQGLLQLTAHTYANYAVQGKAMLQQEFKSLSALLQTTPLYSCHYQKTMQNLPRLCDSLLSLLDR